MYAYVCKAYVCKGITITSDNVHHRNKTRGMQSYVGGEIHHNIGQDIMLILKYSFHLTHLLINYLVL